MENKKWSIRTKYLINPSFQLTLICYFLIIGIISLMIFYMANYFFFKTLIDEGIKLNLPAEHAYFELLLTQKNLMNKIFIISSLVFFSMISLVGIFISHRIAGPIHKMTKMLNSFNHLNDLNQIHFRKSDFFIELADAFNALIKRIKGT